jgi:hypothetical protein
MFEMATKYTKWPQKIQSGNEIYQHRPLKKYQNLPKLGGFV